MDKDIKVSQGDGSRQFVDIKNIKPINDNIYNQQNTCNKTYIIQHVLILSRQN